MDEKGKEEGKKLRERWGGRKPENDNFNFSTHFSSHESITNGKRPDPIMNAHKFSPQVIRPKVTQKEKQRKSLAEA